MDEKQSSQLSLFSADKKNMAKISISGIYTSDASATLFHGDRIQLLEQISKSGDKAQLIVTSPPYNVGKEYERKLAFDAYVQSQEETIKQCVDILDERGSICWQVGHYIDGSSYLKEVFPLDLVLYPIFKSLGLKLKIRIVWTFGARIT